MNQAALQTEPLRWSALTAPAAPQIARRALPVIGPDDIAPIADGLAYWDAWPLLTVDGGLFADADGGQYWFALAAPRFDDPDERHRHARIHLLKRRGDAFEPLGPAMPDGLSPGSREWSGSAAIDPATGRLALYFTAAGRRGESVVTMEQRLFRADATFAGGANTGWSQPVELLRADEVHYRRANEARGAVGQIKAFRDPEYFRDPATGAEWIVFTGSSAAHPGSHDGVIGLARLAADGRAEPRPPLVDASGFNNELERPHIRCFDGLYYLFWSTQAHVFAPGAGPWPTGLFGAVADHLEGPWRLLNENGLVAANPADEPTQAYSWLVLPDRSVTSFVDHWGRSGGGAGRFAGTFAPFVRLAIAGRKVNLADG